MRDGVIWRIAFDHLAHRVLEGAHYPEGRFHHDRQRAFYASPNPDHAHHAVAAFRRPDDPPRVLIPLHMSGATLIDLRDPDVCRNLCISVATASVPWQPQRASGQPATSWLASDAVRASGADGMIYCARSAPERWHLVLFEWNRPGRAQLQVLKQEIRPLSD